MTTVEQWMKMALALDFYEDGKTHAEKHFPGNFDSDKDIEKEFLRLTDSVDMKTRKGQEIGIGYTFAVMKHYFEKDVERARNHLLKMQRAEMPLQHLEALCADFGLSYIDLCLESEKIVTPSDLDRKVFELFTKDSEEFKDSYGNYPALAIVYPGKLPHQGLPPASVGLEEQIRVRSLISYVEQNGQVFVPKMSMKDFAVASEEDALKEIARIDEEHEIKKSAVVIGTHFGVRDYFSQRYFTLKAGFCAKANNGELDTPWAFGNIVSK